MKGKAYEIVKRPRRRHVLIITNPIAGRTRRRAVIEDLAARLIAERLTVDVFDELGPAVDAIESHHRKETLRVVVSAGGDGTIAELVNRTSPGVPFVVLPMGTENLLARHFGYSRRPAELTEAIVQGATITVDAGRANGRIFLVMASVGFDADVVERMSRHRNGHITQWSYARPIRESLFNYAFPAMRVKYCVPNSETGIPQEHKLTSRWLFLFNLPRYARGIPISPGAVETDGLLDLCSFARGSIWSGLWYFGWVLARQHARLADCRSDRVRSVEIECDGRVAYQLDGDHAGWLPLKVEVMPSRLTLMVPSRLAAEQVELPDAVADGQLSGIVPVPPG